MKKLKLKSNAFKGEVLTRTQLKKVMGGVGSVGSNGCLPGFIPCSCIGRYGNWYGCISYAEECQSKCI